MIANPISGCRIFIFRLPTPPEKNVTHTHFFRASFCWLLRLLHLFVLFFNRIPPDGAIYLSIQHKVEAWCNDVDFSVNNHVSQGVFTTIVFNIFSLNFKSFLPVTNHAGPAHWGKPGRLLLMYCEQQDLLKIMSLYWQLFLLFPMASKNSPSPQCGSTQCFQGTKRLSTKQNENTHLSPHRTQLARSSDPRPT